MYDHQVVRRRCAQKTAKLVDLGASDVRNMLPHRPLLRLAGAAKSVSLPWGDQEMIVTLLELADIFGVSPPTVRAWVREGCPVKSMGDRGRAFEFRTSEVHRWLLAREKRPGPRLRRRLDGIADAEKTARE